MRNNQPVTGTEYILRDDQSPISRTDLQGNITFANADFIEASGYTEDELLGQPHNIVRHPDMPEEAFRDLWHTIQSGLPWTGLVKNRRKDASFYWVRANATPMKDGERITGYLSVRTQPTRDEVQAADALYARLRDDAGSGRPSLALERGRLVRRDLAGRLIAAVTPGQRGRLIAVQLAAAAGAGAAFAALPAALAAGVSVAVALAATAALSVLVLRPLDSVLRDALCLSSGDLAHTVTVGAAGSAGDLQQALNQLAVNMRSVVSDVRDEIVNVGSAAQEIASGNQDLSSRTESQASSLEQTAASMEQINGTV